MVFLRLSGGREETLRYIKRLSEYRDPWLLKSFSPNGPLFVLANPALPQFPPLTRVALTRQMLLIDNQGNIVPSKLTELVQIRLYRTVPLDIQNPGRQEGSEFRMSRQRLFASESDSLIPIGPSERKFSVFMTQGKDWLESSPSLRSPLKEFRPVLESCNTCHEGNGIRSVLTYAQAFGTLRLGQTIDSPGLFEGDPLDLTEAAIAQKQSLHDFGLLQGLWLQR